MSEDVFLKEMDEDLEFEPGTLHRGTKLSDLPLWDSMQKLTFMAKVEEKLGIVVEGTAVGEAQTVDDLLCLLESGLE